MGDSTKMDGGVGLIDVQYSFSPEMELRYMNPPCSSSK
jgi:hypothetical protein